jgi:hypothetical protein
VIFRQEHPPGRMGLSDFMDWEGEIALALSACPAFVGGKAAIYVLGKSG